MRRLLFRQKGAGPALQKFLRRQVDQLEGQPGYCSLGSGDARSRHLFGFIPFLAFHEESLIRNDEVYSDMVAVQLDDINRALVGGDVVTVIVRQESFGYVVDRLHKGYNGEIIFSTRSLSPASMTRDFSLS